MYVWMYVCITCMYIYVCMYVCTYMYVCMYVCMYVHINYVCMYRICSIRRCSYYLLYHAILCGFYLRAATNQEWCLLNSGFSVKSFVIVRALRKASFID